LHLDGILFLQTAYVSLQNNLLPRLTTYDKYSVYAVVEIFDIQLHFNPFI